MRKRKYYLYFTAEEKAVYLQGIAFRNKLIAQCRYTDAIDEVMIKVRK